MPRVPSYFSITYQLCSAYQKRILLISPDLPALLFSSRIYRRTVGPRPSSRPTAKKTGVWWCVRPASQGSAPGKSARPTRFAMGSGLKLAGRVYFECVRADTLRISRSNLTAPPGAPGQAHERARPQVVQGSAALAALGAQAGGLADVPPPSFQGSRGWFSMGEGHGRLLSPAAYTLYNTRIHLGLPGFRGNRTQDACCGISRKPPRRGCATQPAPPFFS